MISRRHRKKSIIIFAVIASGVMLGALLGTLFPENQSDGTVNLETENKELEDQKDGLTASLEVVPQEIEATDPDIDFANDVESIKKAVFTVSYTNTGPEDLTGTEAWITIESKESNYGFLTSESAKYLRREPYNIDLNGDETVFEVADIQKGGSQTADIFFYSKTPGTFKATVSIKTEQEKTAKTNSVNLVVK